MTQTPENEAVRRAVELVAGEVPAILSSWERVRGNPALAVGDAVDLLAAWGHLQRFRPEHLGQQTWERIRRVVEEDGVEAAALIIKGLNPRGWLGALEQLGRATNDILTDEDLRAARSAALLLFRQLDEADLAVWAAKRVSRVRDQGSPGGLDVLTEELDECRGAFMDELHLFWLVRWYAEGLRRAYRADLFAYDCDLWLTTAKYELVVEEAEKFAGLDEALLPMTWAEWAALCELALEPSAQQPPILSETSAEMAAAASGMQGYGVLSGLPVGSAEVAARLGEVRHLEFEAEDGSWTGFLRVPRTLARDAIVTLRLNDQEGQPVEAAEVILCGIPLRVERGHAETGLGKLLEAWRTRETEPLIRLRWREAETRGRLKEGRNRGRSLGDSGV